MGHPYAIPFQGTSSSSPEEIAWFRKHPDQLQRHHLLGPDHVEQERWWIQGAAHRATITTMQHSRYHCTHPDALLGLALQLHILYGRGHQGQGAIRSLLARSPVLEQFITYSTTVGTWELDREVNIVNLTKFLNGTLEALGEDIFPP